MKKTSPPLIYFLFSLIIPIITLNIWILYEQIFGLRSFFGRQGDLEGSIIFLIVAIGIYYFANTLIQKRKKKKQVTMKDHFQQSGILYVLLTIFTILEIPFLSQMSSCQHECHGYALMALIIFTLLVGIITNALYLFFQSK